MSQVRSRALSFGIVLSISGLGNLLTLRVGFDGNKVTKGKAGQEKDAKNTGTPSFL